MEVDRDIHRITKGISMVIPVPSHHTHHHGDLLAPLVLILLPIKEAIPQATTDTMAVAWEGNTTKGP